MWLISMQTFCPNWKLNYYSRECMKTRSLDEIRKLVSRKYMGKVGIHGVGIRKKSSVLCVYVAPISSSKQRQLLREIEKEAAPYQVLKIEENQPTIY